MGVNNNNNSHSPSVYMPSNMSSLSPTMEQQISSQCQKREGMRHSLEESRRQLLALRQKVERVQEEIAGEERLLGQQGQSVLPPAVRICYLFVMKNSFNLRFYRQMVDLEQLRNQVRSLQLDCQRMYQELDNRSQPAPSMVNGGGLSSVAARPVIPSTAEEEEDVAGGWNCSTCTFRNHPALMKCEECETPRPLLDRPTSQSIPTPPLPGN